MQQGNDKFERVLSRKDILVLAFGAMIGWGWVVMAGTWIKEAGSVGAMLAFALGGLMVIFVGLTYAELTSAMPKVGGEHVFSYRAMGVGPSFLCTWAIILGYVSVVAFEAVALPTVVDYLIPNYQKGYLWTIAGWDVYANWAAIGIIGSIILTIVNYLGIKFASFVQLVFTALIGIVGIMFFSGALFNGSTAHMEPFFVGGMNGFFTVLIMVPWMFVGFDVIPQAAEEINLPYKTIGKVLIFSVALAALWYILVCFGVGRALTVSQMEASQLVTADAMAAVFGGSWAGKLLIIGGIGGIMTSWNAFYIGGSRAIYAMAHAKMLPGFLANLHPKYKTPTNAILLIGAFSTLAPLLGRSSLVWLVDAGGLGIIIAYLFVSISFLILRQREPNMSRPFRAGKSNVIGYLAVAMSFGFTVLYLPGSPSTLVWPYEWAMVLGWTILGLVFYLWARMAYGNAANEIMHKDVFLNE